MFRVNKKKFPSERELEKFLGEISNLEHHQRIQVNALELIKKINSVEAIFLGGSLAIGKGDIFSDIDFYVCLNQSANRNEIGNNILKNLDQIGEVIHVYPSAANKTDIIVFFKPFIKFELSFKTFNKVGGSWKIGVASELLFDRNGLGEKAFKKAQHITFSFDKYESEVQNFAISIPSLCFIAAGYINRGEIITTKDFIAWMRRNLMRISGFLIGIWDEGTRRAEKRFPQDLLDYYNSIKIDEFDDLWNGLETILDWYEKYCGPLFEQKGLTNAVHEVEPMRNMLTILKNKSKQ